MTAHEEQRLAVLHEFPLLDAPAGAEREAVVRVVAMEQFAGVVLSAPAPVMMP